MGLAFAGVAGIGGIWYKLGALAGALNEVTSFAERLNARVERIENHLFFDKE